MLSFDLFEVEHIDFHALLELFAPAPSGAEKTTLIDPRDSA